MCLHRPVSTARPPRPRTPIRTDVRARRLILASACHGRTRSRPRLPARPARRRADLRGDDRRLAGRADRHAALRRGGHAGPLRRPHGDDLAAAAPRRPPGQLPRAAAAVPDRRPAARPGRLRLRRVEQQRLRPRRATSRPARMHVCYCHSPFRYAWHEQARALSEVPAPLRAAPALACCAATARSTAAPRATVDRYVANGEITRERIRRYWGATPQIVHPPVDVERFSIGEPGDHVLFVGELVRHKRPELAIEAAAAAGRPIKVVGTGPGARAAAGALRRAGASSWAAWTTRELAGPVRRGGRARRAQRRGVRHRRGRGAGRGAAGGRRRRRRRARDGRPGPHRAARAGRRPGRAGARAARATSPASTRTTSARTPSASRARPSRQRLREVGRSYVRVSGRPGAGRPPRGGALLIAVGQRGRRARARARAAGRRAELPPATFGRPLPRLDRRGRALPLHRHRLRRPGRGRRSACERLGVRHVRDGEPAPGFSRRPPALRAAAPRPGIRATLEPDVLRDPARPSRSVPAARGRRRVRGPQRGGQQQGPEVARRAPVFMPRSPPPSEREAPGVPLVGASFVDPPRAAGCCPPTSRALQLPSLSRRRGARGPRSASDLRRLPAARRPGRRIHRDRLPQRAARDRGGQPPASEEAAAVYLPRLSCSPPSGRGARGRSSTSCSTRSPTLSSTDRVRLRAAWAATSPPSPPSPNADLIAAVRGSPGDSGAGRPRWGLRGGARATEDELPAPDPRAR